MTLNYLGYMLADRGNAPGRSTGLHSSRRGSGSAEWRLSRFAGLVYYKMGNYELAEENLRRASERMGDDPTIHDHLGELYLKTGRLKLAASNWERSLEEWNKTVPAEVDADSVAKVQRELDAARVKLAKQNSGTAPPAKQ